MAIKTSQLVIQVTAANNANGRLVYTSNYIELQKTELLLGYILSGYYESGFLWFNPDFIQGTLVVKRPKLPFINLGGGSTTPLAATYTDSSSVGSEMQIILNSGKFDIAPTEMDNFAFSIKASAAGSIGKRMIAQLTLFTETKESI